MAFAVAPAQAANYPAGGSGFNANAEGWSPGAVSCSPLPLLCTPEAVYDGGVGNPPGSIAARTSITLNLLDLFKGTEVWNSPRFTVADENVSGASIRLDRAFDAGGLVDVAPKANYVVTLRDLSNGTAVTPLAESLTKADSTFATRAAPVNVTSGHTYEISIESTTAQSTLSLSLLSGTTNVRFDNVAVQVESSGKGNNDGGGNGGDGGNGGGGSGGAGGNGLSNSALLSLLRAGGPTSATLKGNRLYVKGACPAAVGQACSLSLQGLLSRSKAATTKRTSKVAKGKAKTLVLKVKPKARKKLAKSSQLLFRETVHAGSAKATLYKRLKLIRRR